MKTDSVNNQLQVLDHGYVRLVDHMGNDLSVVRSARVSYNAEARRDGRDEKLIHYLMEHQHSTPFEAVVFTFHIKAPIFVLRQWMRHRTWSYNEISARYTELPSEFYVPNPKHIGVQSKDTKQSRTIDEVDAVNQILDHQVAEEIYQVCTYAFRSYDRLLRQGVPRELARIVLPVAIYSAMFATVNMHNLFRFLKLRLHAHAQYEIRMYAKAILELIKHIAPICVAAFEKYEL